MRLPDGHFVRILDGVVLRRRPSERRTPRSNWNPRKLTSSIVKDTFLASSTTTSKISSLLNLCEELIKSEVDDIRLLNSVLFMISLLIQRINHFFENGCLTPFFKLLYGEFDVVIKRIEALWVGSLSNRFVFNFNFSPHWKKPTIKQNWREELIQVAWNIIHCPLIIWVRCNKNWLMSKTLTVCDSKVGFVFSMVVFSIRLHAEFGPYDHGKMHPLNNLRVISCHNKCL